MDGGRGVSRAANHNRNRNVPSDNSAPLRGRKNPTIMTQNWGASSKPRNSRRCIDIGAELIIETPTANCFAQQQNFRSIIWVSDLDENALEQTQAIGEGLPAFF